jgi:hypothetical protein
MSEAQHQLLITLVHGTWGRGFFTRSRQDRAPFWFEKGSPFLARLHTELGNITHTFRPLPWSGANSIFVRDKTAHVLADHLSAEHAEHPQATQLVIAHSHGGNIALRALHHLQNRDAQLCERANPLVVTLATPFIEIHQANYGWRPDGVRMAVFLAFLWLLLIYPPAAMERAFSDLPTASYISAAFWILALVFYLCWGFWWRHRRGLARQKQVDALKAATQLVPLVSAQRLLVVRAIDDEASLTLALGTISNYATARVITYVYFIFAFLFCAVAVLHLTRVSVSLKIGFSALILALLSLFMVSRTAHGRELAVSPMECQINTHSTPDADGLSRIATLVQRTYVRSLRHGIYDHEDCAKAISDWVRLQLGVLPVR